MYSSKIGFYKERVTMPNIYNIKLIVYGLGKLFKKYKQHISWQNVIACTDKAITTFGYYKNSVPIIPLSEITKQDFDYIVIFTDAYFEEIKVNLMGYYNIPESKIVSWRIFFENSPRISYEIVDFLKNYIIETKIKKMLDIGMSELPNFLISSQQLEKNTAIEIDGIGNCKFPLYCNLYKNIYHSLDQVKKEYDMLFLCWNYEKYITFDKILEIEPIYILWVVPYSFRLSEFYVQFIEKLKRLWIEQRYLLPDKVIYTFKKKTDARLNDCKIFVVTHKKYHIKFNSIYHPICVGNQYHNEEYLDEHTGENIAYLNDKINECTALYWIWKNAKTKYVGLNHYRRYFYNNKIRHSENYLSLETVTKIFDEGYDIILPELKVLSITILENITISVGNELCKRAFFILKNLIKREHPDYIEEFEFVMDGHFLYVCNMFVTHRKILNQYCEWLFSFLIEATEQLDVSSYDSHRKRTMGYFAETMWTVWLLKQNLQICELPIVDVS